jgi:hypothetical protein
MKQRIIFAITMSFILTILMTAWVTFLNLGLSDQFVNHWSNAFVFSWPAAAVFAFVIGPIVQKVTIKLMTVGVTTSAQLPS